ncbi:MAG: hypothetical protein FWH57_04570 [Oscillospiraceae bacterium]|nr:hypothetical protein [Oscillospiraceae bacterium]
MDTIFITVKIPGQDAMDLKVPNYFTGEEFLSILSEVTGADFSEKTKIQAEPIGRILDNAQTFESDGVDTGALLTLIQNGGG